MKLFWHIIASIYSVFRTNNNLPAFSFLFNKPKISFPETIIEIIHADEIFSPRERRLILEAADDMYRFTNGRIHFEIIFDLKLNDTTTFKNECALVKAYSQLEHIINADKQYGNNVIGLCYHRSNETKGIHLVVDRLESSDNLFRTTVIHELGHYLEMDHTAKPSIMQATNYDNVPYPTYRDAVELAKVWDCLPTDLGYFKL